MVKNRLHFGLRPRAAPVPRRSSGLSRWAPASSPTIPAPTTGGWVLMADPEGNEFCVERGELD
ncbi:hypothetical protein [Streptomyces deccanensis]|uniref:hypothetical protein n=1 Tax=Streptomyces deccanensis TaxID=424188 RepID=UPI003B847F54